MREREGEEEREREGERVREGKRYYEGRVWLMGKGVFTTITCIVVCLLLWKL